MNKVKAAEAITYAFTTVLEKLRTQNEYNPRLIIDDLHSLAKALNGETSISLNLHSKDNGLEFEYKEVAEESIRAYKKTTESIKNINEEQDKLIQEHTHIKIDEIMNTFSIIHSQIENQMREANDTIKSLHEQISALEKTSNIDALTKTFNRRALEAYLKSMCEIKTKNYDTYILLIDIDDFKLVNDHYGHLAGDRVLMFLAKVISNSLRDEDKLFRFGGEEFLIIMNRSDKEACEKVAKRILEGVRTNTLLYKEHQIKITLSIGTTSFDIGDSCETLIERADKALYKAKHNGKDQIVVG